MSRVQDLTSEGLFSFLSALGNRFQKFAEECKEEGVTGKLLSTMKTPNLNQLFVAGNLSDIQRSRIMEEIGGSQSPIISEAAISDSISLAETVVNVKPGPAQSAFLSFFNQPKYQHLSVFTCNATTTALKYRNSVVEKYFTDPNFSKLFDKQPKFAKNWFIPHCTATMDAESLVHNSDDVTALLTTELSDLESSYAALPNNNRVTTALTNISLKADNGIYRSRQLLNRIEKVEKAIKTAYTQCSDNICINTPYQFEKPRTHLSDLTSRL